MIKIKTPEQIAIMRQGGRILAEVLGKLKSAVKTGVSLFTLDEMANKLIKESGAEPAFLGYKPEGASKPYPATICASLNGVVVHGVPTNYALRPGDALKIDLGLRYKGFLTDIATTVPVEVENPKILNLIKVTEEALYLAINETKPGNRLGDIGHAVQKHISAAGFFVVKSLTGHGIGREFHEDPVVYNFGQPGKGPILEPGMVLAIEPITALGTEKVVQLKDESYATSDNSFSAHFEHTVAVTMEGPLILTKSW